MRANRRYGDDDPQEARLASFAARLTAHGCRASAGQVSRWESGQVMVPHRVVSGYERALGLPDKSLVGVVDALLRQATAHLAPSSLDRRVDPDDRAVHARAEDLLDRALGDGTMSGSDWDDLTILLCALKNVVMPTRLWGELATRLLAEQLVADGGAWRLRGEATHRLLWHPRSRPHVIAACAAVVRDPRCPIVIEPLAILDLATEPSVAALLLSQLTDPVDERAVRGALLASISKVRQRQFTADQLGRVAGIVVELLGDPRLHAAARPLAGELVGHLPPALRDRSVRRLRRTFDADLDLAGAVTEQRTAGADRSHRMVQRIVGRAVSSMPGYTDATPDEMLARLVDEMLFSTNLDVRLHAAQLAGATPFREPLAGAVCAELRRPPVIRDAVRACAILETLPFIATRRHRQLVETMLLAPGLDGATSSAAAWTISHIPGHSAPAFWSAALDRYRRTWLRHRSAHSRETLRGLTYALGIAGDTATLAAVRAHPDMPADSRHAAQWWAALPSVIRRSARL
ncbi:hypothetical protein ACFO1B_09565 [Dactylosporangium siamense]|uniref:Uncharacterized protein n=1 Tax=Dactylosporangium siamense TaxID=685454 RepID=A0A919UAX0_9ACTN|nr:hypothetical protein [Dactylosporangium siamense]GIG48939.1 hypothetical protein Dsi01nite_069800 [Dactylosporangium siamense]